jgi:sensor histidine kinase YesM
MLSAEDMQQIAQMLASDVADTTVSGQVGIRNVNQRLDLLYGSRGSLTLLQAGPDRILARVRFPAAEY